MDGGAWPFLVGGVICLVNSDNERDSPLLNSRLDLAYGELCWCVRVCVRGGVSVRVCVLGFGSLARACFCILSCVRVCVPVTLQVRRLPTRVSLALRGLNSRARVIVLHE